MILHGMQTKLVSKHREVASVIWEGDSLYSKYDEERLMFWIHAFTSSETLTRSRSVIFALQFVGTNRIFDFMVFCWGGAM